MINMYLVLIKIFNQQHFKNSRKSVFRSPRPFNVTFYGSLSPALDFYRLMMMMMIMTS